MSDEQTASRMNFFEQLHQQFLYLKGYGTYAYVTPNDVDRLYDAYISQQNASSKSHTCQFSEVSFIRSYIKSLQK